MHLEAGNGTDENTEMRTLWRRYPLKMEGFECDIVEMFPDREMFVRPEWIEEATATAEQLYDVAVQTPAQVSIAA